MYHFFVSPEQVEAEKIRITGQDVNHIRNVLRMREGEQVKISDGVSRVFLCEIEAFPEKEVLARILKEEIPENELPAKILLFQGVPKSDKMELIIQKAVELGASAVVPVAMKRCVSEIKPAKEKAKISRFQGISEAAAKQSGRDIIPEIKGVMTLREAVSFCRKENIRMMVPYEKAEDMEKTRRLFESIGKGDAVGIFIGPEGGFDESETEYLLSEGADTLTLGKRILRTETAGLYVLSVLGYLLG